MRTLNRNKRIVYLAKRVENNELDIEIFDNPMSLLINLQPLSDKSLFGVSGEDKSTYLQGIISKSELKYYEERARVYVENKAPFVHDMICENADYVVDSIKPYMNHAIILLKRRSGE